MRTVHSESLGCISGRGAGRGDVGAQGGLKGGAGSEAEGIYEVQIRQTERLTGLSSR